MEPLPLLKNNQQRGFLFVFLLLLFFFNLFLHFQHYQKFKENEVFHSLGKIVNIYPKDRYTVLKIETENFTFFTSVQPQQKYQKLQNISLFLTTEKISFFQFIKGFYANSFNIVPQKTSSTKMVFEDFVANQHQNQSIASLYNALFFAIPIDTTIRTLCADFGISHLVAISGFHLGVMSVVLYFLLHLAYNSPHQKYLPYRNKRYDIMVVITAILFGYLLFVDMVPSLLRAFAMFLFGLFLLRNNIKLLSFETLFITVAAILALFPHLLFSLSFWFSVSGVFYIFLFLHYFQNLHKYLQVFLFNFWIYLAMNPVVHYFFSTTSLEQLFSPFITLLFTLFYPLVAFLHLLQIGGLLDQLLLFMINYPINSYDISTPLWFFLIYIAISLLSIISKKVFYLLNLLLICFTLYLFVL